MGSGAGQGVGRQVALHCAAHGAAVVVNDFHLDRAQAVTDEIAAAGGRALASRCDVSDFAAVGAMVADAEERLGGIDVLVNNAGVFERHALDDTTSEEWQEAWRHTLSVNLAGAANVTWCALRHMGAGGRIVNVSSRGAFRGEPEQPAYGASKAGLIAFGQSLARALGDRRISVTAVAPGFVETEMAAAELEGEGGRRRRAESPLGRVAVPEEIAAAVHYLASPEAEMASGAVIDVNGASYLRM